MTFLQLRANALIKRGSMYMQQQQPLLSTQDFNTAAEIDPRNADVYHHRGQVLLLTHLRILACFPFLNWLWVFLRTLLYFCIIELYQCFLDCNNGLLCPCLL